MRLPLAFCLSLLATMAHAQTIHQFTGDPALDAQVVACDAHMVSVPPGPAGQGVHIPASPTWPPEFADCPATMTQWSAAVAAMAERAAMPPPPIVKPVPRPVIGRRLP